jgi:hypothetical protein
MSFSSHPDGDFGVPLTWSDFDESAILFANHFLVQYQPDEFVVTIGQSTSPPLVGTPDQVREQARELTHVPIFALARVAMSRRRVTELIAVLQATLEEHDRTAGPVHA